MQGLTDIVLFSTADWDNPFWTNKQHVTIALTQRGHRVLYIESVGLRAPTANGVDIRRIARRLRNALRLVRRTEQRVFVLAPFTLPLQRYRSVRNLNRLILNLSVRTASVLLGMKQPVLWTYNPMTTALLSVQRFPRVIYHCVDDIAAQPGMPAQEIEMREGDLVRSSDIVFVTAPALKERLAGTSTPVYFYPNVADTSHFSRALRETHGDPPDVATLARPRIIFVGAISAYKIDVELLTDVANRRPDWSLILIGKVGEGEPGTNVGALSKVPNIHLIGPRSYERLPDYLAVADVAIIPARRSRYTDGMFPMKYFEYLSAGLPVVTTDLPALRGISDYHRVASNSEEFVAAIEAMLRAPGTLRERRSAFASEHTYERRTESMIADILRLGGAERW